MRLGPRSSRYRNARAAVAFLTVAPPVDPRAPTIARCDACGPVATEDAWRWVPWLSSDGCRVYKRRCPCGEELWRIEDA